MTTLPSRVSALAAFALVPLVPALAGDCADSVDVSESEIASIIEDRVFTVGGRIGDRGGDTDFELFAGFGDATFAATKQFDWPNEEFVPFCLTYDAINDQFDYVIGGLTFSLVGARSHQRAVHLYARRLRQRDVHVGPEARARRLPARCGLALDRWLGAGALRSNLERRILRRLRALR